MCGKTRSKRRRGLIRLALWSLVFLGLRRCFRRSRTYNCSWTEVAQEDEQNRVRDQTRCFTIAADRLEWRELARKSPECP